LGSWKQQNHQQTIPHHFWSTVIYEVEGFERFPCNIFKILFLLNEQSAYMWRRTT
jgi:hypothetical protein